MAPGESGSVLRRYGRELGVATWIAYVVAHVVLRKAAAARAARAADGDARSGAKTVKIRLSDGTYRSFTESGAGRADMSWFGTVEFYVPVLVQASEVFFLLKLGRRFYDAEPGTGRNEWTRFMTILWAAFGLMPVVDGLLPEDWTNPAPEDQKHSRHELKFRAPLYVWTALEVFLTFHGLKAAAHPKSTLSLKEKLGVVGSMALFNGAFGINIAHELMHKSSALEKALANVLLLNVNYMHWGQEHLDGHHDVVATPEDAATSRLDESVYAFLPRTVVGAYRSAWNLEMQRIEREGGSKLVNNRMIAYALAPLAWGALLAKATGGGAKALGMFYAQGAAAALILEMVNYIEHYGLLRDKLEDGSYEPVQPVHSWNAPQRLSNSFLFKLQRHSDHHTYASRPYHLLRVFDESPQMPSGYTGMLPLALFPPIWRWIMNPLVRASKVKRADDGEGFVKDAAWHQAQRTAKLKFAGFAAAWFALATYGLRGAVKAAHKAARASAAAAPS